MSHRLVRATPLALLIAVALCACVEADESEALNNVEVADASSADSAGATLPVDAAESGAQCLGLETLRQTGFGRTTETPEFDARREGLDEDAMHLLRLEALDGEFAAQCRDEPWATDAESYLADYAAALDVTSIECRTGVCRAEFEGAYVSLGLETLPESCGVGSTAGVVDIANNRSVTFISRCGFRFVSRTDDHLDATAWETPVR